MTDHMLFERWLERRDAEAFRELAAHHVGMMYSTCQRILKNHVDAEDVTQECLEKLSVLRTPPRGHFGAWLHALAVNGSLDRIRERTRRFRREQAYAEVHAAHVEVQWDDLYEYVDEAIASLPATLHAPVVAHFLQGASHAEVAESLGISRRAVTHRIAKGLQQIRRTLRRRGIAVAVGALSVMLTQHAAEAAPASIVATIGKLAVSQVGTAAIAGQTTATSLLLKGGLFIMAKKVLAVLAVVIVGLLLYGKWQKAGEQVVPAKPSSVAKVVSPSEESGDTQQQTTSASFDATEERENGLPSAVVRGIVVDDDDRPLAGAAVRLKVYLGPAIASTYEAKVYETVSDQHGQFEFSQMDVFGKAYGYAFLPDYVLDKGSCFSVDISPGGEHNDIKLVLAEGESFIRGQVISELQQPIPGAFVEIRRLLNKGWGDGGFAVTDADGHFAIALPDDDVAMLTIKKEGYGTGVFENIATGQDGVFLLVPCGRVAGHVVWRDGHPARGVLVEAVGEPAVCGWGSGAVDYHKTLTDEAGTFSIHGLSEELIYTVAARDAAPLWAPDDQMTQRAYFDRISTGEDAPDARKNLHVEAGETALVNLMLSPTARLFGRVTDAQKGSPMAMVRVLFDENKRQFARTMTDQDGNYEVILNIDEPHEFQMMCGYDGCSGVTVSDAIALAPGEEREFSFAVPGPMTIPVKCVDADGKPVRDVTVCVRNQGDRIRGQLHDAGGMKRMPDEQGRVTLTGVPPTDPVDVVALRGEKVVGASQILEPEPGKTFPEVRVIVAPYGGISGIALDLDGHPIGDKKVFCSARLKDSSMAEHQQATTDKAGNFQISPALPQGRYDEVYLWYLHEVIPDPDVPEDSDKYMEACTFNYRMAMISGVKIRGDKITELDQIEFSETIEKGALRELVGP